MTYTPEQLREVATAAKRLSTIAGNLDHVELYGRIEVRTGQRVLGYLIPNTDGSFHFRPSVL